jgi:hypothetical protein
MPSPYLYLFYIASRHVLNSIYYEDSDFMARATKIDLIRREKRIQALMAEGADRTTILNTVAKEEKVSPRTIEEQYYEIVSEIEKLVKENRSELRAQLMARQEKIFKQAMSEGMYKTALDATVAQAKLAGLNDVITEAPKRPEVITIKERDFSSTLTVVPKKAENE